MRQRVLILVILAMVASGCAAVGGAGVDVERARLEQALDEWAVGWSTGVEKLLPLFTDDVRYEELGFGAVTRGKAELRRLIASTFDAIADMKIEVRSRFVAADGKSGVIEWLWRGRQVKDLPGLPARDRPFAVRGTTVVQFRDGKISRNSDYWNLVEYMKQVGAMR